MESAVVSVKTDKNITAIWHIFSNQNKWSTVELSEVEALASTKGILVESIQEIEFGFMPRQKGVLLKTNLGTALYPRERLEDLDLYQRNIVPTNNYEKFWHSVDWFSPAFMSRNQIFEPIKACGIDIILHENYPKELLQKRFDGALSSIYDFSNIIPITEDTLRNSKTISQHVPLIRESILAFYSGMKVIAIAGLIPIVESIISTIIGNDAEQLTIVDKVNKCIDKARANVVNMHFNYADWVPEEYLDNSVLKILNERVFMLETIRHWLLKSFYSPTADYDNHSGFNRHIFAHAKSNLWHSNSNFFRALGVIQAMAFVECFAVDGSSVSLFGPVHDENSESLRQEVFACMNYQLIKNQLLTMQKSEKGLPFNPTSSDDGWLTRAAILSEKMDKELVPNLRDKGWDCHYISDPIKDGEYITVNARKEDKEIKVALLFSCASSNVLYKKLDETHQYIIYQGHQYKQSSFARGVKAEVRPLSAWIAPN
ncbi:hypothetical protein FPT16_18105 [Vibrio cholerae]|nr:hypothetical protein [Vibrio cholerae]